MVVDASSDEWGAVKCCSSDGDGAEAAVLSQESFSSSLTSSSSEASSETAQAASASSRLEQAPIVSTTLAISEREGSRRSGDNEAEARRGPESTERSHEGGGRAPSRARETSREAVGGPGGSNEALGRVTVEAVEALPLSEA